MPQTLANLHEPEFPPVKRAYTLDEAAQSLGIKRSLLYSLIRTGEIASILIGARRVVPATALDAYLQRLCAEQRDYEPHPKSHQATLALRARARR